MAFNVGFAIYIVGKLIFKLNIGYNRLIFRY